MSLCCAREQGARAPADRVNKELDFEVSESKNARDYSTCASNDKKDEHEHFLNGNINDMCDGFHFDINNGNDISETSPLLISNY